MQNLTFCTKWVKTKAIVHEQKALREKNINHVIRLANLQGMFKNIANGSSNRLNRNLMN